MPSVALFVPCYVDQLYPQAAIAALRVLEQLGVDVAVPDAAVCCGQPPANAGFEHGAEPTLRTFVRTYERFDHVIVLSGSCAMHVRLHAATLGASGARVAARVTEFCGFLHDHVGVNTVAALDNTFNARIALHIGCHALRGLGLASASEVQRPAFNKVRALLETVQGISFADFARADECCGFGGSFAVGEPDLSARMGHDRLRDFLRDGADALVSTDMSCVMHLQGLAQRDGATVPMMHVAQVLARFPGA